MSDSLCDAVDIYLTGVHNMHLRILHGRGVFGRRPSMRRAIPGIAVLAAGLLYLTGCTAGGAPAGGPAPSADGIGPITFAIGGDNPGWVRDVITGWNERHPGQQVTLLLLPQAANDQLAQLVANLQAKSDLYDVIDMDVIWTAEFASNGWIIPLPQSQFPLGDFLKPAVDTARYQGRLYAVPDYSNADLLYYRKDILAKAGKQPPKTWAQLQQLAETVAPEYGLYGYAGTFAPYEGLTVNFAEAVEFLFLDNWPDVYAALSVPGPRNKVYGKFGIAALPGLDGTGSSSLGGANLAISAYSQHQRTALNFIKYMTNLANERQMLERGSFPPVWTQLYRDKSLISSYHYLPVLEQAINSAQPRPAIANYDQASLAISSTVYEALTHQKEPQQALTEMAGQLTQIIRDG